MRTTKRYIVTAKDSKGVKRLFYWIGSKGVASYIPSSRKLDDKDKMTEHELVQFSKWVDKSDINKAPWVADSDGASIKKKDIRVVTVVTTESRAMNLPLAMRKRAECLAADCFTRFVKE